MMPRRKRAAPFRPVLNAAAKVAVAASIGSDVSGSEECRYLLIRFPDDWTFKRIDDTRLVDQIETVKIGRRHPDGIPVGRYLRVPVEPLVDPWGRVAVGLEFETPQGLQSAELTVQTHDDAAPPAEGSGSTAPNGDHGTGDPDEGIRLSSNSLLRLTNKSTVFFVEGNPGDMLDLTDDETGQWSVGDSDGAHTLYIRRDRSGRRSAALAVRCGIAVKVG